MKKFTKNALLASLVFGLCGVSVNYHLLKNKRFKSELTKTIKLQEKLVSLVSTMPKANASVASEVGDYVKMLYYMINGYPSQAVWNDLHAADGGGPPVNGMLGMTNQIGQQMSAVVQQVFDIGPNCTDLSANTISFSDNGVPMTITIAAGTTAMPAAFPTHGGSANALKLTITKFTEFFQTVKYSIYTLRMASSQRN